MERRKAVQNLALIAGGIAFLPGCSLEETEPVFDRLALVPGDYRLVSEVSSAILPQGESPIETLEPTADFVLTMVNDVFSEKESIRYVRGLGLFKQLIKDEYQKAFSELNAQQHVLLFTEITHSDIYPKTLKFFLSATKQLTIRHFTSSEYFMSEKLDFEFAPGRYKGNVDRNA